MQLSRFYPVQKIWLIQLVMPVYLENKDEAKSLMPRVNYRYILKLKTPLFEEEIKTFNGLQNLSILKNHIGTNFRVASDLEARIETFEKKLTNTQNQKNKEWAR